MVKSNTHSLLYGFLKLIFSNLFSKVISIAITWKIANLMLSDIKTDKYFFLSNSILLFAGLINNLDTIYIMPQVARLSSDKEKESLLSSFFKIYIILGVLILTSLLFINEYLFSSHSSKINHQELVISGILMIIMVVYNYFNTICYYSRKFNVSAILTIIVQMITFSFLYFSNLDLSVTQILLYQIVSYLVSLLILLYYQSRELGFLKNIIYSNWGFSRKQLLDIAKLQAGFISAFLQNYLIVILLGTIGVGLISSYNYSNQLLSIPGQFFLTYFSIIVGVKLNDFATGDFNQNELDVVGLNRVIAGLTILSTIFTVVVSLYFYYNSTDLLKILFSQSGINSATLDNAAIILSILILYIPAAVINILYSRILHISKNVNYASLIQIFFNLLLIVLSFVLSIFWGYQGVIIGVTAGYIIHVYFVLPLLIQRRYPFIRIFKTTMYSALYFLISFIIFYILFSSFAIENIYLRLVNEFFLLSIYFIFSVFLAERFRLISIFSIFPFLSNFNVLKRASR